MTPEQYVQDKAQKSGSSFYYAFMFLPPARRQAMTAFYAFCREVDDVADEVTDPGVAATMKFVDTETEPRLERMMSELRTHRKRAALEGS